ncbi:GtrA family protein [Corynebacterium uberis]|uniref:GtrA family protein n=1 Tax=Corynebacterium TaxID=1716 RepID=UPI001D0A718F|nr:MULTISPECIES: GtrA family protein [Corynebacterium]MCZ9308947.1 GtrA family protein [Corynebacterium sp. c6VSa_13]UDL74582.1 GtrA family protein [Corynebacterium uberis]UDL76584.1 GtrA family protein [Corynebacterium uberis]UDL78797.1 GtrA family protein [Corynebacterium uberis]UDL81075.1 GtrA family protein [Corynebacterium uberis]
MAEPSASRRVRLIGGMRQFLQFGIVGGSGVIVNMAAVIFATKMGLWSAGLHADDPFMNILGTAFNVRWYHIYYTFAFLVANTWNYQMNRMWTFRGANTRSWWRGFFPFLFTGVGAFLVTQVVATLLMNPTSPIALSDAFFDGSSGLRTKHYWANLIATLVAMPINFVINKLWTFRGKRVVVVAQEEPAA